MKVNELIGSNFFQTFKTNHSALYTSLFGSTSETELNISLLLKCGTRDVNPLLKDYTVSNIISLLVTRYGENWSYIRSALSSDYDILEPYNITTTVDSDITSSTSDSNTTSNTNGVVAFDSSVVTDKDTEDTTSTSSGSDSKSEDTTTIVSGNLGILTNSDLIQKELELRKRNFIDIVMNDISSLISLDIY